MASAPRRLYRSRTDRMLSGVSGGLAAYFDVDPVLVRLLWVVGAVFSGGLLVLAYLVLWIVVPEAPGPYPGPVPSGALERRSSRGRLRSASASPRWSWSKTSTGVTLLRWRSSGAYFSRARQSGCLS